MADWSRRGRPLATVLATVVLIAVVFGPAVIRPFASDHLWYLADLGADRSLLGALSVIDYSVMRTYWTGDLPMFRPLTYVWFALEQSWWGTDHVRWNLTGLVLHGAVVMAAYRLMRRTRDSWGTVLIALLIAVPMPAMEMVLWTNTSGFVWATGCLVVGLTALRDRHLTPWTFAMTAAVFLAEFCVPVAALGALLWRRRLAWLPVVAYVIAYGGHLLLVQSRIGSLEGFVDVVSLDWLLRVVPRMPIVFSGWLYQGVVPGVVELSAEPYERFRLTALQPGDISVQAGLVLIALAVFWPAWRGLRERLRRESVWSAPAALALMLLVCCLGRRQSDLLGNSYYLYPFWVLGWTAAHALMPSTVTWTRGRHLSAHLVVAAYIGVHCLAAWRVTEQVTRTHRDAHLYLQGIRARVEALPSGAVLTLPDPPTALDPEVLLLPEDADWGRAPRPTVTEIVFAPYVVRRPQPVAR